jgi:ABC-type branched-subunit amino acid transport system ATPase component/ABC-type branched-subunit amino acid transport system permease subunit
LSAYVASVIALGLIYGIVAVTENLSFGYAGQFNIAQAAFFSLGAYGFTIATAHGWGGGIALFVSLVGSAAIGGAVAFIGRNLKGDFFLIVTLAFQVIVGNAIQNVGGLGGATGLFGVAPINFLGFTPESNGQWLEALIPIALVVWLLTTCIGASRFGIVCKALRRDESATASLGRLTVGYKVAAMAYGAAGAALGGALYASFITAIDPTQFTFQFSVFFVSILLLGGVGNPLGPVVGAAILTALPEAIRHLPTITSSSQPQILQIIYGLALLVIITLRPAGIVRERAGRWSWIGLRSRRAFGDHAPELDEQRFREIVRGSESAESAVVDVVDVAKSFGGLAALRGVSLHAESAQLTSIIGPNGAGKSTLFGVIGGGIRPDRGEVRLNGIALSGHSAREIARRGVTTTFQDVRTFSGLSVVENIAVGARNDTELRQGLALLGLAATLGGEPLPLHAAADSLSYGQQKLVAMARSLPIATRVLLLDEPAAGLDVARVAVLERLLAALVEAGRTVILVEHNVRLVMDVSDRVVVLAEGQVLAVGDPEEVRSDSRVIDAYIGHSVSISSGDLAGEGSHQ